ncbi:MAG: cob(I)yrinic acid a,c-diamide adenosyltransferase, partial [SAR324 cluster bacterium]|nr:cob(I)yrinic acid a,c-diamide adenosyltransferase [SAR324 cluster bacterium]
LTKVQNQLFDIGAILASPEDEKPSGIKCPDRNDVAEMEEFIDSLIKDLPDLESFVLPGGNSLNSTLHLCRTVCRRVERNVLKLQREENVPQEIIIYLNRLSDLFFAMARYASTQCGSEEYLWEPKR